MERIANSTPGMLSFTVDFGEAGDCAVGNIARRTLPCRCRTAEQRVAQELGVARAVSAAARAGLNDVAIGPTGHVGVCPSSVARQFLSTWRKIQQKFTSPVGRY